MQLNQTSRQHKMMQMNNSGKSASKRGSGSVVNQPNNSNEMQYKLQLPEIMQQQQTKIN